MSTIERCCRWRIAEAWLTWSQARHATFAWLAYCRALGLRFGDEAGAEGGSEG